jgi:hypothetical protein
VSCSFAGGCSFQVSGVGVATLMRAGQGSISVCDEACVYQDADSTGEIASCKLSKLSTMYSDAEFAIEEMQDDLRPRTIFGTLEDNDVPFDENLLVHPVESDMVNGECYIGVGFKAEHVGMLRQVKWFMKDIQDKTLFADEVIFQGSDDETAWVDIFTMDENVHDGWNYVTWTEPDDYPK